MSASRKYQRYFKPISSTPFSTAGTIRAQGRVGQTSHARSNARTLFKGVSPVGHGGNVGDVIFSCNSCSGSSGQSTMTNNGYILSRVVYPTAVFNDDCVSNKCNSVQYVKDFSPENSSQSSLLQKNNAISMSSDAKANENEPHIIGTRKMTHAKKLTSVSSSEYMRTRYLHTEGCCSANN